MEIKKIEIKKGDKFKCIKNYFGYTRDTNALLFKEGNIYTSNENGCICNELGENMIIDNKYFMDNQFIKLIPTKAALETKEDRVSHPSHYTWLKDKCGIEVIDITRHLSFDRGNAVKYLLRAGYKSEEGYSEKQKLIEDLKKAIFYINDELNQIENGNKTTD